MDGVEWRCYMRRLFVPLAPRRLFSVCRRVALVFGIACLAGAVPGAPQRGGATYHVSPTGSDSNPGSAARPFRTIQKAANGVKPGDTVLVDDGVYTYSGPNDCYGKVVVCVSRGGSTDSWVVFRSKNKWGAKIDGGDGKAGAGFVVRGGASYVRIQGFEITGLANADGSAGGIDLFDGGSHFQVVGNR